MTISAAKAGQGNGPTKDSPFPLQPPPGTWRLRLVQTATSLDTPMPYSLVALLGNVVAIACALLIH